eukprot:1935469-Pyramimonas_sp.AAC.1
MTEENDDSAKDKQEWFGVSLAAIHICRPYEEQLECQAAAFKRAHTKHEVQQYREARGRAAGVVCSGRQIRAVGRATHGCITS